MTKITETGGSIMQNYSTVAILGAGISGLSIARALKKKDIPVTIYEKNTRPGGVIQSQKKEGWLLEKGPTTLLVRDQKIWDLLDELQLTHQIIKPGDKAKKRYIVRDGRLIAAPMGLLDFLKTDLFSAIAKFRLLKEPFIGAGAKSDESIAKFIRRRLGTEVLDYAINPFISGIYAGNPGQLSAKHTLYSLFEMEQNYGSLTKGFLKKKKDATTPERALISFDEGLHVLPQAMAEKLDNSLHLNTEVLQILPQKNGWKLKLQSNDKNLERDHAVVISTLPSYQLSDVWTDDESQGTISELSRIKYAPMSVLTLGFKRDQIDHPLDGFGMLIPKEEPFSLLGGLFSSSLFNKRAPKNHVLLSCFIGGARHPDLASKSTEALIAKVQPELEQLLGVKGKPVFRHHTFWPQAIPQYTVGYDNYLETMEQIELTHPGFFLAGNYRGGVSVPDCILNGLELAKKVQKYLPEPH